MNMLFAVCGYLLGFILLKTSENTQKRIIDILTFAFPVSEIIKILILCVTKEMCLWYFPFQLCSMPVYMLPLRKIFSDNETVRKRTDSFIVCFFIMAGTVVFMDTSGMIYSLSALTVHSYLWHILMIATGILICADEECDIRFDYSVCVYLLCCLTATFINIALHRFGEINMFYISPFCDMNQMIFKDFGAELGQTFARNLYIIMSVVGAMIVYRVVNVIYRIRESRFHR